MWGAGLLGQLTMQDLIYAHSAWDWYGKWKEIREETVFDTVDSPLSLSL